MNDSRGRAPKVKVAQVSPGGSEKNYNRGGKDAQHGFEAQGDYLRGLNEASLRFQDQ